MKRVILIILDGCGIGGAPDAEAYGDVGANTLGNLALARNGLRLPQLQQLGLGNLLDLAGVPPKSQPWANFARGIELSAGKDTISGHFEIAGYVVTRPFATFPQGFPDEVIQKFCEINQLEGVLGNKTASGTEIIKELGEEHLRTGLPIVYTSADSVFQIAAHETAFGLEKLYQICRNTRKLCDELHVARVIARPFITENGHFVRTYNRKDYAIKAPEPTLMEFLQQHGIRAVGYGKIPSIYNYIGFDEKIPTSGNDDGMAKLMHELQRSEAGLHFINLIDFDMLYGHRRDVIGFARALERFDRQLKDLIPRLSPDDLLVIMADHGNDPTFRGTDHTREKVPILAFRKSATGKNLGDLHGFYHVAATIFHFLTEKNFKMGQNFV